MLKQGATKLLKLLNQLNGDILVFDSIQNVK